MAVTTTVTNNLRYHMTLGNGGTRYIDIENPIDNAETIASNITAINNKLKPGGQYEGILASEQFFNGDTDATVTAIYNAETIRTEKTVTTNSVFTS